MSLPNDIARCPGESGVWTCDERDRCQRYTDRGEGPRVVWMGVPPEAMVYGWCPAFIELPADFQDQGGAK